MADGAMREGDISSRLLRYEARVVLLTASLARSDDRQPKRMTSHARVTLA
jgi:hypothetical protein